MGRNNGISFYCIKLTLIAAAVVGVGNIEVTEHAGEHSVMEKRHRFTPIRGLFLVQNGEDLSR